MHEETATAGRGRRWLLIAGGVIGLVVFGSCVANMAGGDEPNGDMAEVMCEDFVSDRLKSPSSADFQRATHTSQGTNTWKVSGAVDSDNGFGASIRLTYECTVRAESDGAWTLVDLQHSER